MRPPQVQTEQRLLVAVIVLLVRNRQIVPKEVHTQQVQIGHVRIALLVKLHHQAIHHVPHVLVENIHLLEIVVVPLVRHV